MGIGQVGNVVFGQECHHVPACLNGCQPADSSCSPRVGGDRRSSVYLPVANSSQDDVQAHATNHLPFRRSDIRPRPPTTTLHSFKRIRRGTPRQFAPPTIHRGHSIISDAESNTRSSVLGRQNFHSPNRRRSRCVCHLLGDTQPNQELRVAQLCEL